MDSWPPPVVPRLPGRGNQLVLHDTASGGRRATGMNGSARMYACGITPYDATHLGHGATYTAWDLIVRVWRDAGHEVRYVQNVTDVDDPLLERAARDGEDWQELAAREVDRFRGDMLALRLLPPSALIGAVEAVPEITEVIDALKGEDAVYDVDGDLYFPVDADPQFGAVSHLDHETMVRLSRDNGGDPDRAGKQDPVDPLLWRAERHGEPAWSSPFGRGRPGWHVECAAIAWRYLGADSDVVAGGRDLVFPHHEMSASHGRVATGADVARVYTHAGLVGLDGDKMSKSRGNLVFVSALRGDGQDPMAIRLAILAQHYRTDWPWDERLLHEAEARYTGWRRAVNAAAGPPAEPVLETVRARLADDLDAPGALAAVDAWVAGVERGDASEPAAPSLVRATVDALLGVAL